MTITSHAASIVRIVGNSGLTDMEQITPQAYLTLSNMGGMAIEINNTGESVRYQWYDKVAQRSCRIDYTSSGRAFFRARGRRWYLDEFLKI